MQIETGAVKQQFGRVFGEEDSPSRVAARPHKLHVVRGPGRVNLIGEHTDYNDGFVLPMAIEPHVLAVCRARDDGRVRLASALFPDDVVEFSVQEKIAAGEPKWANYVRGVAAELLAAGIPLVGMDLLITNTLPPGGGLSSSAALEVAVAHAMLLLAGTDMDRGRLALLCQKAEHDYAMVPCGIMDQTVVAAAKQGHAMLLDCRSRSRQFIPIDSRDARIVIVNSMVRHELDGSAYGQRRRECEEAVAYFRQLNPSVRALRDVTVAQIEDAEGKMDDTVFKRARHVVSENARTLEAATRLAQRDYEDVGDLMTKSHESLRDDYDVSCAELDFLVDEALSVRGVYGARMTGGGFGGCIVALVQPRAVEHLSEHLKKAYPVQFGKEPGIFVTTATAGVSVVE